MPELLLELGCEELPATFVERAYTDLKDKIVELLTEANVMGPLANAVALDTPRRLSISVTGLVERQPDEQKEMRGPAIQAAFNKDGNPTKALEGICRSSGVDVSAVRKDDKYVWVDKLVTGRNTEDLLTDLLPQAIKSLTFDKTMRRGS